MKLTPAMHQYMEVKKQYPNVLVLFRMGDFYETFYEDAKTVSKELNIVLTSRGKDEGKAPLAGIPYHALEQYLTKLIKKGYKVAICEQLEDPRFAKGIVKRGVVRIVTPGTVMESYILNEKSNNYIMALARKTAVQREANEKQKHTFGLAFADISTGEFVTTTVDSYEKLSNELTKFNPKECIIPVSLEDNREIIEICSKTSYNESSIILTPYDDRHFWRDNSYSYLTTHFRTNSLQGFGIENGEEDELSIAASGALIRYLKDTQKTSLDYINKLKKYSNSEFMIIDSLTQRNLELVKNIRENSTKGTLFETLDITTTAMGSRLLKNWILKPLLDINEIKLRQDSVAEFAANIILRADIKETLTNILDIERLISRVSFGTANARDLLALKQSIAVIPEIKQALQNSSSEMLRQIAALKDLNNILELIDKAIKEEPPISVREGGIIKKGYSKELGELLEITTNAKQWIARQEENEKEKTGIKSLKIRFNNVFGYYIEITKPNLHLVPHNYTRKQTQVNSERFITEELKEKEAMIMGAEERINALEYELFTEIVDKVKQQTTDIQETANKIAQLDVLLSLAISAAENNYTKPEINCSYTLSIKEGRHPVIEKLVEFYVPNDIEISEQNKIWVITGPNMSGKSSLMRQLALIVLMAQTGSFVPASSAVIGVVDRIFTRVGAHDDLAMGQSTFMVEMSETANILNNATSRSLIILDEIGRGTSTFDGISIAWSVAEYIHNKIGAKTLFATHYHQMNKLAEKYKTIKNYNIAVDENENEIVFLRKLIEGGTDKSYGIQVAKLAGLPQEVIEQSKAVMSRLEIEDKIAERIHSRLKENKDDVNTADNQENKIDEHTPSNQKQEKTIRLKDFFG